MKNTNLTPLEGSPGLQAGSLGFEDRVTLLAGTASVLKHRLWLDSQPSLPHTSTGRAKSKTIVTYKLCWKKGVFFCFFFQFVLSLFTNSERIREYVTRYNIRFENERNLPP